jgi:cytochrome c-type biogenesis protein CcmH
MFSVFSLYYYLGNPQLNELSEYSNTIAGRSEGEFPPLPDIVALLERHLARNTADANGWLLLSSAYVAMDDYDKAVRGYEHLYLLAGDDPGVLLGYANALVGANNGFFAGRPMELIQRVLSIDPVNYTALFFSGLASEQAGNYQLANDYYAKILPSLKNNPELLQTVNMFIARNSQFISDGSAGEQATLATTSTATDPARTVALHVSVSEDLIGQYGPGDTVFVYAQAPDGSAMPLAVVRTRAADLPLDVVLDDTMAMTPATKLSDFAKVKILARISGSGNAKPESGDLVGEMPGVDVAEPGVINVIINSIMP